MSAARTFVTFRFLILLPICGLALLMSCRARQQGAFILPKSAGLPTENGVYVLDSGSFTRLTDNSPGPDAEDVKHRIFSKDLSILVFEEWVKDPAQNINSIAIMDYKSIGEPSMDQVNAKVESVQNHHDMFIILPEQPMRPGLYTLQIGNKSHDYQLGVKTPDIAAYWNSVLKERPNSWQAHNHLGAILFMKNDIKGAYPHFLKAVQLNPQNCESNNNLGLALSKLGRKREAIHEFETALTIIDDSAIATNLANTYLEVKQYDDAVKAYQHALTLNQNNSTAHCNLGYALMQRGKVDEAIVEFRKTVELDPSMTQGKADLEQALRVKANKP